MAGERMRVEGFGEVSGVCVDPVVRGEGLGAVVTLAAAHGIRERGDQPMLHVRDGNDGAHRLYRRLGFEVRRAGDRRGAAVRARTTSAGVPHRGRVPAGVGRMPAAWHAGSVRTGRLLLRCRGGA